MSFSVLCGPSPFSLSTRQHPEEEAARCHRRNGSEEDEARRVKVTEGAEGRRRRGREEKKHDKEEVFRYKMLQHSMESGNITSHRHVTCTCPSGKLEQDSESVITCEHSSTDTMNRLLYFGPDPHGYRRSVSVHPGTNEDSQEVQRPVVNSGVLAPDLSTSLLPRVERLIMRGSIHR
ncbi:hypothetical protein EYF80_023457 [Liparis tanakae]|uniref:Uncharacterized protein n=1 Tax=Liparis tanakae TaxID=230148 RepID=A0A4Z2HLC3_9TELE|nr:hypothetical protein EYF80_023457 [Liparis tanakae]